MRGKFRHHSLKIDTNKGNTMFTIIRKKTLENLQIESMAKSMTNANLECQINNLEKKVNDQREVIVNMMILLDFFSQKVLKRNKKKGKK